MKILVTGGAGFIGSAVVRHIIENTSDEVRVIDCLTYAGNLESLAPVAGNKRYSFSQTDITDAKSVAEQFSDFRPDIVMHLAAESHVDRSIDGPAAFIQTNLIGTFTLLEAARQYWSALDTARSRLSASTIFRPMKSTATCTVPMICSPKRLRTRQAARTLPPRPAATILSAPGTAPMACRWW